LKNRHRQFVIDGEAVVLGVDGIADFNALHSRRQDEEVQLYAFDNLALDGEDLRSLPLSMRKTSLAAPAQSAGRNLRRAVRARRDRSRPVHGGVQVEAG
jgi:ATP-dependent DNA ligase